MKERPPRKIISFPVERIKRIQPEYDEARELDEIDPRPKGKFTSYGEFTWRRLQQIRNERGE